MKITLALGAILAAGAVLSTSRADEADELNRVQRVAYCLPAKTSMRDLTCKLPEVSAVASIANECRQESKVAARMALYLMGARSAHADWSTQTAAAMGSGAADQKACLEEIGDGNNIPQQCREIAPLSDAATVCLDKAGYAPSCRRIRIRCEAIDDALPY
jgi:hypothetical protein